VKFCIGHYTQEARWDKLAPLDSNSESTCALELISQSQPYFYSHKIMFFSQNKSTSASAAEMIRRYIYSNALVSVLCSDLLISNGIIGQGRFIYTLIGVIKQTTSRSYIIQKLLCQCSAAICKQRK